MIDPTGVRFGKTENKPTWGWRWEPTLGHPLATPWILAQTFPCVLHTRKLYVLALIFPHLACSALSFRLLTEFRRSSVSCSISSIPVSEASAFLISFASLAISSRVTDNLRSFTRDTNSRISSVFPNSRLRNSKMS